MKRALIIKFLFLLLLTLTLPSSVYASAPAQDHATADEPTHEETPVAAPAPPAVHLIKVEGVVDPVMSAFLIKSLDEANAKGAEAVVIMLDTPGGLDLSMRDIVKAFLASPVPIVVYVAPPGSRAASAGVFLTYAAHIAAMAPGTNIGSAHPVNMDGEKMDETMTAKVENDAVGYLKSIAAKRERNADWAEKAVRESVNITAGEALKLGVIDLVAEDSPSLLKALDGRSVTLPGAEKKLKTASAEVVEIEMGLRDQILSTITNPNVAYILMMIGMLGLYFELANPGAIFPGVMGAICLVLAFYSFQSLPVNYAGLVLMGLAVVFFIAEVMVVSFGFLTLAGIIALTLGSLMLFDSPLPFMRVSLSVLIPTVALFSLSFAAVIYFAVKLAKRRPVSGEAALIGVVGTAISKIDHDGTVMVEGEYWEATSTKPIKKGSHIKVVEIDGLKLKVKHTTVLF